jgi:diguanylate cyclase (GGDEF)-like protein
MTDERPTILVADDERINRTVLAELLGGDYRVLLAGNGDDVLFSARQQAEVLALILLDVSMPGMDGYEVLSALRADERTAGIAVVFITGQNEEADEELGLRLGAADYIHKPIRPAIVAARVRNLVKLALQKRELRQLAQQDGLTGIANRRHFDEALDRACRNATRSGEPIGLALIDIDHFKKFNDHYGHIAGDDVLRTVARLLGQHARRPYDLAARYGGEEFALLAPHGDGIIELVQRFRQALSDLDIVHDGSPASRQRVTVSCGAVVMSKLAYPEGRLLLVGKADELLYQAKQRGRDQVVSSTA